MVLAAGLGTRIRPLDPSRPKPLVRLAGRALIDHVLDRLAEAGIEEAVVNVHHMADLIEAHLAARQRPRVLISDERGLLLDTGGGVKRALEHGLITTEPLLVHNSDSVWLEREDSNLGRLFAAWDATHMDCLMLLADRSGSLGYDGRGDFDLDEGGHILRPDAGMEARFVFAGVSLMSRRLLDGAPAGPFSLNKVWSPAIAARRVRGIVLNGVWMHVGDPAAHAAAETCIAGAATRRST
jgi:N-acetyl-alpha-D-muramate 1-phosphate uridylyltransferase